MSATLSPRVFEGPDALGETLAHEIADGIAEAGRAGHRYVLGCPGGRSPKPVYDALAVLTAERGLDLRHVVIAMMDEYVVPAPGGGYQDVPHRAHNSCHRFADEEIVAPLNAAAGPGRGIPADAVWFPHPADPAAYEEQLVGAGGVDLFILASGASDGHIAFNPPGSPEDSGSRVTELADTTREDNLATFPGFASLDEVPHHGVTVGVRTIVTHSRRAVMVVHGDHKREAVRRLTNATGYDPSWPATLVTQCKDPALYVDRAAAGPPQAPDPQGDGAAAGSRRDPAPLADRAAAAPPQAPAPQADHAAAPSRQAPAPPVDRTPAASHQAPAPPVGREAPGAPRDPA
ncbi:6-phosphogluconolactonase [Streptomyces sp. NPDC004610]|uniref:6-phosphogluconolactonase n=1 Tax=unclassified Streptomyces TaxID=2593676 RepID=UPI0033B73422